MSRNQDVGLTYGPLNETEHPRSRSRIKELNKTDDRRGVMSAIGGNKTEIPDLEYRRDEVSNRQRAGRQTMSRMREDYMES